MYTDTATLAAEAPRTIAQPKATPIKSAGKLLSELHPNTPTSIRNLYGRLNEKSPELCASLLPLWYGIEEVRSQFKAQYSDIRPARNGVCIVTVQSGKRTYARAQHADGIFHGGARTMGLKREGSPEHREYRRRIAYRDSMAWLAEMEESAKAVLKCAIARPV